MNYDLIRSSIFVYDKDDRLVSYMICLPSLSCNPP